MIFNENSSKKYFSSYFVVCLSQIRPQGSHENADSSTSSCREHRFNHKRHMKTQIPAQAVAENPSRMVLPPPQRSHIGPGHAATAVPAAAAALAAALPPPTPEIAPAAARAGGRVRALRVTQAAAWCCGRSEAAVALHAPRSVRGAGEDLP